MRRARSEAFVARNSRAIRDLQERGLADRDVDPELAPLLYAALTPDPQLRPDAGQAPAMVDVVVDRLRAARRVEEVA